MDPAPTKTPEAPHQLETGPVAALMGIQETLDPCHWERVSQPWELLATPMDGRAFRNCKRFVATPDCLLYHETFSSRTRVHALSPEDMLAVLVPVTCGSRTSYVGLPLQDRGLPATLPAAVEAMLDAGQEQYVLLIRLSLLERSLPERLYLLLRRAARGYSLAVTPGARARLAQRLGALLARAHGAPDMLRHLAAVRALERELLAELTAVLQVSPETARRPRESLRRLGFDAAIVHLRRADLAVLDVPKLCAAAGVSQRTLEYAFQEHLGLSPKAFVRGLRLHALRRRLLAARLGESSVTELAYHLGFSNLGRLAGDYRRTFGERPSDTLARSVLEEPPPLWWEAAEARALVQRMVLPMVC